ncbi:hypothetical protein [Escherichia coli]
MRVACIGLLPYPTRFWASALIAKPQVLMADNITPAPKAAIPVLQRHDEQQRDAGEQSDEKP